MSEEQRRRDRWRSLEELAGAVDPDAAMEFAPGVDEPPVVGRRDLGKLLGASLMLAGAAACTRAPKGRIVAYGRQPEQNPGVARTYATTMTLGGYGTGLLVEEHEGRPTKLEGNEEHPASLGASGVFEQASLLSLYDPNRLRGVQHGTSASSFQAFARALARPSDASLEGIHVLLEPTASPELDGLLASLERRGAVVHVYEPLSRANAFRGLEMAIGRRAEPLYELENADIVVALDSDLLAGGPFHLRHARKFAERRRVPSDGRSDVGMNRLYAVEPALTVTGSVADHRLRSRRSDIIHVAAAVLRETLALLSSPPAWALRVLPSLASAREAPDATRWALAVARDLVGHRGRALVAVGDAQPPRVHALGHLINAAVGAIGGPVRYVEPASRRLGAHTGDLASLLAEVDRGKVDTLVIVGGNPSYTAPADLEFARRVGTVRERMYVTEYANETSRIARWLVPAAHYLESWGDARAKDGTVSFVQPMIEPLYGGKTSCEVLSLLQGEGATGGRELLLRHWRAARDGFDDLFPEALKRGVLGESASDEVSFDEHKFASSLDLVFPSDDRRLELAFQPDAHARDGAFANNAWLLELPDPITKLTWGNAACLSTMTARRLALRTEDIVDVRVGGLSLKAPVLIVPGHADDCVTLSLGFGREGDEELARGVGVNAYALRTQAAPWAAHGVDLVPTGERASFAITQEHSAMEDRPIALAATIDELVRDPRRFADRNRVTPTLYQVKPGATQQWAMTIDLNICTGCSACVVACQAENNVPVVGKEGVLKGRAMHWLRIDRYFEGSADAPAVHHQPMACQHCEKAPCEYVCPVGATVHSDDGLNEMVYNRCVGTRFCSNNCPYKVRRFNWFDYNRDKPETLRMAMNPDVTVRARGVMEKCTYCVQRIRETEIRSHTHGVPIRDGDVRTACEQACPTRAITFGSIADPTSRVSSLRRDSRAYAVLHELGTEPRTRYLARIRNPSPDLLP